MNDMREPGFPRRIKVACRARASHRTEVDFNVAVAGPRDSMMAVALDVSEFGILILGPRHYPVGETMHLRLHVPGYAEAFMVRAVVRWIDAAGSLDDFVMGCRFLHTPETFRDIQRMAWRARASREYGPERATA